MIKINHNEIKISRFPNNEALIDTTYLNTLADTKGNTIEFQYQRDEDLLHLKFVLDHLLSKNCAVNNVVITYMPYSRMDRDQNGNCFTLKYVLSMFKTHFMFNNFYVVEPHSEVTLDGGNIKPIYVTPELCRIAVQEHPEITTICFLDKGAQKRYTELFKTWFPDLKKFKTLYCEKVRDFDTGNIVGLDLVGDTTGVENVLIADDLCSKGGTFYYTAKKLKEVGVKNVFLAVTHMEHNVVNGELVKPETPIQQIYTTDSMGQQIDVAHIKVIPLSDTELYHAIVNNDDKELIKYISKAV